MAYKPEELCMQSKASMQDLALIVKELTNTDSAEELSVSDMADKLNVLTIRNVSNTGWEEILSPNPFTFTDICLEPKEGLTNLANIIRAKTGLAEADKLTVEQMQFLLDNWGNYRVVPVRFVTIGSDCQGANSYDITCTIDGMSETHTISFDIDGSYIIPFDNGITVHINSMGRSPYYWAYYGCDCGQDILNCDIDIPDFGVTETSEIYFYLSGDSGLSSACQISPDTSTIQQPILADRLVVEDPEGAGEGASKPVYLQIAHCPDHGLKFEVEELSSVAYRVEQTFSTDSGKNYVYSSSNYYDGEKQKGQISAIGYDEYGSQQWGLKITDIRVVTYDEDSSCSHVNFKYGIVARCPVKLKIKAIDLSNNNTEIPLAYSEDPEKNIIKLGAI